MKIVFVSNYYNHHQASLSEAFFVLTDGNYYFIQTQPMEGERKQMGWGVARLPVFVKESYLSRESYDECIRLINDADVVITGSAPNKMLGARLRRKKLVFRYSERIYKNKKVFSHFIYHFFKLRFNDYFSKNVYMLCASGYAAADFAKTGMYLGKTYKWGYFPAVKKYEDIDLLINRKQKASILWVARLIEWKHPEASIQVAGRLKRDGYAFKLCLIGGGVLQDKIARMIKEKDLEDVVHMLGVMKPEEVRRHMEQSQIFLFTSDQNEGWGAVLNEAMNSGCAVVASEAIGSVPFLIKDGVNGLRYENGNIEDLTNKVKFLLDHPEKCTELGKNAYSTMTEEWNADTAAERFIALASHILSGEKGISLYELGPCSRC